MPNKWIDALKTFNQGKTEWCIPRKGGKEYEDIKRIMNGETITQPQQIITQPRAPKIKTEGKNNAWITHVKQFAINRGITYTEALKKAKATYKKPEAEITNAEIPAIRLPENQIIVNNIISQNPIIDYWGEIIIPTILKQKYPDIYNNIEQYIKTNYENSKDLNIADLVLFTKKYNRPIMRHYMTKEDRNIGKTILFNGFKNIVKDICNMNNIEYGKDIKINFYGTYNNNAYMQSLRDI